MSNFKQQFNLKRLELDRTVNKIKDIRAEIKVIESKVKDDKIIFRGVITEDIIYVGQEGIIYHQLEELNFSICLPVEKASKEQAVELTPWIEYLDFQLADEGKYLEQKIMLKVHTLLMKESQLKVKPGVAETYRVEVVVEEIEREQIIENEFKFEAEINEIKKIEEVTVEISNLESKAVGKKAVIHGKLQQQFFFCDKRDISRQDSRETAFAFYIDNSKVDSEMELEIDPVIESVDWELVDSTAISTQVVLSLQVRIIDFTEMDLALNPTGQAMLLDRTVLTNQKQVIDVSSFELESFASDIRNIETDLRELDIGIISDRILIQGQLDFDIYYLANIESEADVECHQQETLPFSTFIEAEDVEPGMEVEVEKMTELQKIELINSKLLKQETLINLEVTVLKREQVNVTTDKTGRLIIGQKVIDEGVEEFIIDISN